MELAKELYLHLHGEEARIVVETIDALREEIAKSKEELEKNIILMFKEFGLKPKQISEKLEIELARINDILKKHKLL